MNINLKTKFIFYISKTNFLKEVLIFLFLSLISISVIYDELLNEDPIGYNDLSPMWNFEQLFRPYDYPWDFKSNLGTPNFLIGNAFYNAPIILISFFLKNVILSHKIWIFLLLTISEYGFYILFKYIFKSCFIGVIVGLYGIFNNWYVYILSLGHNLIYFAYSILPYTIYVFLKYIHNRKSPLSIIVGLLTGLIFLISSHIGYIFFTFMIFYILIDGLFAQKKLGKLYLNFKYFTLIISLPLLMFIPLLINILRFGVKIYTIRFDEMIGYFLDIENSLTKQYPYIITIFLISSIGIYFTLKNKKKLEVKLNNSFYFTLIILTISALFLSSGIFPPLVVFLSKYIPGFIMMREINKLLLIGVYLLSFFIALIFNNYLDKYKLSEKRVQNIFIMLIIGLSIFNPISYNNLSMAVDTVQIPDYYINFYRELLHDPNYYRIAFFPPAVWVTHYNFSDHFFLDPIVSLQAKPTLELKSEMDSTIAACFTRWAYFNIYQKRVSSVGRLLELTGVKYIVGREDVYVPNERDDLRLYSQVKNDDLMLENDEVKNVDEFGPLTIYETRRPLPHIFTAEKVALIVGDRRSLLSLLELESFDPVSMPPIFIDNIDDLTEILDEVDTLYLDPSRFEDLILALASEKITCNVHENLPSTSNIKDEWVPGWFTWYIRGGFTDASPDGYAITESGRPISINFNLHEKGKYRLMMQCFVSDSFMGAEMRIDDGELVEIKPVEGVNTLGQYRWLNGGTHEFEAGNHRVEIVPDGNFNAISKITLISEESYKRSEEELPIKLRNVNMVYIIEDHDWPNKDIKELVEDIEFCNGYASRIQKGDFSVFIPENSTYVIQIALSGNGNITLSLGTKNNLNKHKLFLETTKKIKIETPEIYLDCGWNNLEIRVEGDIIIDNVFLYSTKEITIKQPRQPDATMISGSKYVINNVHGSFLVFLESWNSGWQLWSEAGTAYPMIGLGFANLFEIPDGTRYVEIEFQGAQNLYISIKISIFLIVLIIVFSLFYERRNN